MLPGFPKSIKTTKIKRREYIIERDDGEVFRAVRLEKGWVVNSSWKSFTLNSIKYDIKNGFTSKDQLDHKHNNS